MLMTMKEKKVRNFVAMLLAFVFAFQVFPAFNIAFAENENTNTNTEVTDTELEPKETPTPTIYEDGVIFVYNEEQLKLIGSNKNVTVNDFDANLIGNGENITDGDMNVLYSSDAKYKIVNSITLHDWQWPDNFKGQFIGAEETENRPIYDKESDTIYLYHPYQIKTMTMENRNVQTVLSGDAYQNT